MILRGGVIYEVWDPADRLAATWKFYSPRPYDLAGAIVHWPDAPTTQGWMIRVGDVHVATVIGREIRPVEAGLFRA